MLASEERFYSTVFYIKNHFAPY